MWNRLKERWKVESGWDVAIILIVFACTGFSVMYAKRLLYDWVGITNNSALWMRAAGLIFILMLYQVLLLMWGWLWGKFDFFWQFEQKMIARLGGLFRKKS